MCRWKVLPWSRCLHPADSVDSVERIPESAAAGGSGPLRGAQLSSKPPCPGVRFRMTGRRTGQSGGNRRCVFLRERREWTQPASAIETDAGTGYQKFQNRSGQIGSGLRTEASPALGAARAQYLASTLGGHSCAETVRTCALQFAWLIRSFHDCLTWWRSK